MITKRETDVLKIRAQDAKDSWIGTLEGGSGDIAYYEGGHKLVRNDDKPLYPVAKYISVMTPVVALQLIEKIESLERALEILKTDLSMERSD